MTKRVKSSNIEKKEVKIVDHYPDLFFLKNKPVSEAFIQRIAQDMIAWAQKPNSLRITQFYNELGIPNTYIYRWMEKYEDLKLAHDYAFSMIADRREIGAIEKRYDSTIIRESMPIWDPAYKAHLEWKAKLAKQEEQVGNIKVVIEKFPTREEIGQSHE